MDHANPFFDAMHATPVSALFGADAPPEVYTLKSSQTVEDAIRLLSTKGVLSAPVLDAKTGNFLGFVDSLDIVSEILKTAPDMADIKAHNLAALEMAGRALSFETLDRVVDLSGRDAYAPVFDDQPMTVLISLLSLPGIHRVPVYHKGDPKKIIRVASQSTVIHWLAKTLHMGKTKDISHKTLTQLGLVDGTVRSVGIDAPVMAALKLIDKRGFGAVAVTEKDGKLGATFSATDARGLSKEQYPDFLQPLGDFLEKWSPESLSPTVVHHDTELVTAIRLMSGANLHRLWIVSPDYKPIGCLSLTAIISFIKAYKP